MTVWRGKKLTSLCSRGIWSLNSDRALTGVVMSDRQLTPAVILKEPQEFISGAKSATVSYASQRRCFYSLRKTKKEEWKEVGWIDGCGVSSASKSPTRQRRRLRLAEFPTDSSNTWSLKEPSHSLLLIHQFERPLACPDFWSSASGKENYSFSFCRPHHLL